MENKAILKEIHSEHIPIEKRQEIFTTAIINFTERLFSENEPIGFGNFASVYEDPENNICYKSVTRNKDHLFNNVEDEVDFLETLHEIDNTVKVPIPLFTIMKGGKQLLAMEKINGPTLGEILRDKKELPETYNSEFFWKNLKKFVEKMHNEYRIYHRDLREDNIMIEAETGKPVVIDFGAAVKLILTDENPYAREPGMEKIAPFFDDEAQIASLEREMQYHLTKDK
ncbi:MAG: serine/threonine-protein kinase [Candidatus Pacebacteria bacterium]|jgi:serine/threonine protein kinase|nr:serine/threonine-protein kinase [Candidatus Paceibacterota bacterium]